MMGKNSKLRSQSNHPIGPIQPVQVNESDNDENMPEDQWPKVACLTLGGLSQQGHVIHEICHDAIWIVEATMVTQHAWPELHKGTLYKCQVLLEAISALRANNKDKRQDTEYKLLHNRILKDEKFIRTIGKWVYNLNFKSQIFYSNCWRTYFLYTR